LLGAAAFVLLWLIASAVLLFMARQRVNEGIRELEDARRRLSPGALVRGEGREPLRKPTPFSSSNSRA